MINAILLVREKGIVPREQIFNCRLEIFFAVGAKDCLGKNLQAFQHERIR